MTPRGGNRECLAALGARREACGERGDLVYTIHRDGDDKLHVYRHGAALDREPALVVLDQPNGDRAAP